MSSLPLLTGETATVTATVYDASGKTLPAGTAEWSSTNGAVAAVSVAGLVTAVAKGSTELVATAGTVSARVGVSVRDPVAVLEITPDAGNLFVGQAMGFTVRVLDAAGGELTDRAVEWSSSAEAVLTVSAQGYARGVGAGSATVRATVEGVEATAVVSVLVNPVRPTSDENFKNRGYVPVQIPLGPSSSWFGVTEEAHAFGDFYGEGLEAQAVFTASLVYDVGAGAGAAEPAVYRFWRNQGGTLVEDNSILNAAVTPCLHPRKALVADFNIDGKPDIFLACTGFDGGDFPGEPNQVLLSQSGGGYLLQEASPDTGFWHGAAAADLNGDGYPDVVAVEAGERAAFFNDGDGTFTKGSAAWLPGSDEWGFEGALYFTVNLVDVDEDGYLDLLLGGHEWPWGGEGTESPTGVWINPGTGDFSGVEPVVIPAVPDEGVVLDFAVTGSGADRTVWVLRTGGNAAGTRFYDTTVLQRFDWADRTATVVHNVSNDASSSWAPWILPYVRNGVSYIGSSDLRRPLEHLMP